MFPDKNTLISCLVIVIKNGFFLFNCLISLVKIAFFKMYSLIRLADLTIA